MMARQPQMLQMSIVETGQLSSVEKEQRSVVETGQMSAQRVPRQAPTTVGGLDVRRLAVGGRLAA